MNEKHEKYIPQGEYVGHIEHFPNQAKNVFTFIIDEAEDDTLIGKGVSQLVVDIFINKSIIIIHAMGTKDE